MNTYQKNKMAARQMQFVLDFIRKDNMITDTLTLNSDQRLHMHRDTTTGAITIKVIPN